MLCKGFLKLISKVFQFKAGMKITDACIDNDCLFTSSFILQQLLIDEKLQQKLFRVVSVNYLLGITSSMRRISQL